MPASGFPVNGMAELSAVVLEMWRILLESSPYMLLGIAAAGFIRIYVNQQLIARHLQSGRYRSVFKAALLGIPLPL